MFDEYFSWEDEIRIFFIELADYMNEVSNPLDYILKCTEQGLVPKLFTVQNAKDELKKLRTEVNKLQKLKDTLANPVAYAKINERGNLYDLRLQNNPYTDQKIVVPLYRLDNDTKK